MMSLSELHRIKGWLIAHRARHPIEGLTWDAMLTVWLVGWVGLLPSVAFEAIWAAPLCIVAMFAPTLYVTWRDRAHRARRLRCDWLVAR